MSQLPKDDKGPMGIFEDYEGMDSGINTEQSAGARPHMNYILTVRPKESNDLAEVLKQVEMDDIVTQILEIFGQTIWDARKAEDVPNCVIAYFNDEDDDEEPDAMRAFVTAIQKLVEYGGYVVHSTGEA